MKKRILCVVAVVLLIAILPTVLLIASAAMPKVYDETYYAELSDMVARLKSAEGKRLILVGNSDIAFGQFSRSVASVSLPPHGLQHARLPCLSPTPRA